MSTCSTYIDTFTFKKAVTGLDTASLIGNQGRLTQAANIGDTSLHVGPATTVDLAQFDPVTVFDGLSSEQAMVGTATAAGASIIPLLQPLQSAHAQYATYCTDGPSGSLADTIVNASSWIEDQCQQSLFQQVYTNEILHIPSMQASIDNRGMLVFNPRHFPISSDSVIAIQSSNGDSITYDATKIIIDSEKQLVSVPWLAIAGSTGNWDRRSQFSRQQNLFLTITYTAGYNPIPGDIRDCAVLRTSAILARQQNPSGAVSITTGKRSMSWSAGKNLPENLFTTEAREILLSNYKRKV